MAQIVFDTLNGQTLTVVYDGETATLRIAKQGHNRAVAKLDAETAAWVSRFLAPVIDERGNLVAS